jgi:hypothetical protein
MFGLVEGVSFYLWLSLDFFFVGDKERKKSVRWGRWWTWIIFGEWF